MFSFPSIVTFSYKFDPRSSNGIALQKMYGSHRSARRNRCVSSSKHVDVAVPDGERGVGSGGPEVIVGDSFVQIDEEGGMVVEDVVDGANSSSTNESVIGKAVVLERGGPGLVDRWSGEVSNLGESSASSGVNASFQTEDVDPALDSALSMPPVSYIFLLTMTQFCKYYVRYSFLNTDAVINIATC